MKILKWLIGTVLTLATLVTAIALLLPNEYAVERSIQINAPAEKIYPLIATPKEWKNWSVWNQRDPAMHMSYSGPEAGNGAAWEWQSKSQGNGDMKFNDANPPQKISYQLHFEGMGKPSVGNFVLENQGAVTKVTWSMQGSSEGNLMMKLFAPFMDKMLGPDFEAGLLKLKKIVEQP
jgi:uncharacterized protein YndB with AHSA1/START domain